jgi:hypothetical protein
VFNGIGKNREYFFNYRHRLFDHLNPELPMLDHCGQFVQNRSPRPGSTVIQAVKNNFQRTGTVKKIVSLIVVCRHDFIEMMNAPETGIQPLL